jgi:acyl-CoA dehydrogenase
MRWLGLARRAHDLALEHAVQRPAFGTVLAELGMVQQQIADSEIDLAASRALILTAAAELDAGGPAATSTSIAKTFVAEAVHRVVDRSVQLCGSVGVLESALLSRFLREVRPFRIYDGPSETHRWAIARRAAKRARDRIGRS